jgi:hypothetical protein
LSYNQPFHSGTGEPDVTPASQLRRGEARKRESVLSLCARAIWSRHASARAELVGAPSASRPNLFAGD